MSTLSDVSESRRRGVEESRKHRLAGQRVIVTGAAGQLGRLLVPAARRSGATVIAFGSRPGPGIDVAVDLAEREAARRALRTVEPNIVIHGAACTDVDGIEREPGRGERSNAQATRNVTDAAKEAGAYLIAVSTDMVFPGDGGAPYAEEAATAPISAYGRSKLVAEHAVLEADAEFAVARTAWLYGERASTFRERSSPSCEIGAESTSSKMNSAAQPMPVTWRKRSFSLPSGAARESFI